MHTISRRKALIFAAAAAGASVVAAPATAEPAAVPSIWDGEKMYTSYEKDGTGISYPGKVGRPKAFVAFDTQCPYCVQLMDRLQPYYDRIDVVYMPVTLLSIHSEPQATTMLLDKNPHLKLEEHHDKFRDPEFRGLRYGNVNDLPVDLRNKVWTNTKIHRRSGCLTVPYGVFKNAKGEYVPFDHKITRAELAKIFDLE